MSGTVLSARTDRHTSHSSGAARAATSLRRTAKTPVVISPPAPPPPALPPAPVQALAEPIAEPGPALTLTLAIPLTGDALSPQAYRLLDALRELVELSQGAVTMEPAEPVSRLGAAAIRRHEAATVGTAASVGLDGSAAATTVDPVEVRLLTASRQVLLGGEPLAMTRLEFDLLLFLAGNPRRVFTRAQLLSAVWGYEHTGERTVDVHVRRLRVKMGVHVPLITTVYGVGYRLDDEARIVVVSHE